jgi:hypothetical protein
MEMDTMTNATDNSNQAVGTRLINSESMELGLNVDVEGNIILVIQTKLTDIENLRIGFYTFSKKDVQAIQLFNNILTLLIGYHRSYGCEDATMANAKNESEMEMSFSVTNVQRKIITLTSNVNGLNLSIVPTNKDKTDPIVFVFRTEDSALITRFKNEFTKIINNTGFKLPARSGLTKDY